MIPFEKTDAFTSIADDIFRGLITGGGLGNIINGSDLDSEEAWAFKAGNTAYTATDGNTIPALLTMIINAKLGGTKIDVFNKLESLGVGRKEIDSALLHEGKPINYRMLWDSEISQTLISNFPGMPQATRTAMLAHCITLFDRMEYNPAPPDIRGAIVGTAQKLLSLTRPDEKVLAVQLKEKLDSENVGGVSPGTGCNAGD
jgi:hypothetical protein